MAVITGQKTKDNIKAICNTTAMHVMVSDLYHGGMGVNDIKALDFSIFNSKYDNLGGSKEVQPRTLGAVQDAVIIVLTKCYELKCELLEKQLLKG